MASTLLGSSGDRCSLARATRRRLRREWTSRDQCQSGEPWDAQGRATLIKVRRMVFPVSTYGPGSLAVRSRPTPAMPNLRPQQRKTPNRPGTVTGHRCRLCRHELHLVRRHVSPPRLGAPLTTEFYQCGACDAGFALNVATGKWKRWVGDDS